MFNAGFASAPRIPRRYPRRPSISATLAGLCIGLSGCVTEQGLSERYVTNTPDTYVENKVFYVDDPTSSDPYLRELKHYFEAPDRVDRRIDHGDPLAVIVSGVRLPEDLGRSIDAAVVLDLHTGQTSDEGRVSMVVWYQRNVHGGQMLNFQNLLVFADDQWDSSYPPYFRLRVLDVAAERNAATRLLLEEASQVATNIGPLLFAASTPAVTQAIQAAKAVLGNRRNKVIVSYDVQFYSDEAASKSRGSDLGVLVEGTWLVVGRPRGATSDFWRTTMALDRRTDQLLARGTDCSYWRNQHCTLLSECAQHHEPKWVVPVPYVRMSVGRSLQVVSQIVDERADAIKQLLSSPRSHQDLSAITRAAEDLSTAAATYVTIQTLRKERTSIAMQKLVLRLKQGTLEQVSIPISDMSAMLAEVERLTGLSMGSASEAVDWWDNQGGKDGGFPKTGPNSGRYYWQWDGRKDAEGQDS